MSASASKKNTPNPEKVTKKRKLAKTRSRLGNPSKGTKDFNTITNSGKANTPPKKSKIRKAPAPSFHSRIESKQARKIMAGNDETIRKNLQRISQVQDPEEIKRLIREMGLPDHTADIRRTEQARLRAEQLKEQNRISRLIFDKPSYLTRKEKDEHAQAVAAEQKERDKREKAALVLAEKAEKDKEERKRESARLLAQMAKLRAESAKNPSNSNSDVKVGVYTNRKFLGLPTIKEEGRKRKGSKKGKKGRPAVQKKSRKKKN